MIQIEIKNLNKVYDKNIIFENFNEVLNSEQYIFLQGSNGSGKTTLINCILSLTDYTGEIIKDNLTFSYTPEKMIVPDYMTVNDFLYLVALNKKKMPSEIKKDIDYYLNKFNIDCYKEFSFNKLSKGTKQKTLLIQTLMCDSDVYIFDEPLSGLDIGSRKTFCAELRRIKKQNKLIIISSHHIDEYNFKKKKIIKFPIGECENYENNKIT